jgi:hypothetical protein
VKTGYLHREWSGAVTTVVVATLVPLLLACLRLQPRVRFRPFFPFFLARSLASLLLFFFCFFFFFFFCFFFFFFFSSLCVSYGILV